jgi:hypothetical protein
MARICLRQVDGPKRIPLRTNQDDATWQHASILTPCILCDRQKLEQWTSVAEQLFRGATLFPLFISICARSPSLLELVITSIQERTFFCSASSQLNELEMRVTSPWAVGALLIVFDLAAAGPYPKDRVDRLQDVGIEKLKAWVAANPPKSGCTLETAIKRKEWLVFAGEGLATKSMANMLLGHHSATTNARVIFRR